MSRTKVKHSLPPEELERMAQLFKLLGEPMRLRILQAVCEEPRSVNEIVEACAATQANVSKHLALLTAAGVLKRQKDGQRVFYGLKDELVMQLCQLVHARAEAE